ncbi:hypothetical protein Lfu02_39730 [Longispora fulva]|uniref:Flavin-dependent dehydrogenase n=1 Tax=Longispora fulva TaxID=619741 RepID=A0A8J7GD50_9ACTN|nr:tryptophan 7-halogenase [Longispora fulva]MBG6136434.1 flavin-dependent dehydrogenase [Longispora fulva]GIG59601.1 hypothetical protein Lfu02_39730 [Longispora fulva]
MIQPRYDVVIMGGGPAGATLGAQLARSTNLSVVIFEKEIMPREHIGESLAHPTLPAMEEIGVLRKFVDSDFWVKKYGGIFQWGTGDPSVGFFDHRSFLEDGEQRWTGHVNREEFDHMLLLHAEECGAEVHQGVSVSAFEPGVDGGDATVTLRDGTVIRAGFFVDASGRRNSIAAKQKRAWLSKYKNIAIWRHYVGARHGYTIEADWNIFRERNQSPITCAAFNDGWCWYIPVMKVIDGERRMTHSVGIVTIPGILQEPGKDFTDPAIFDAVLQEIPLIRDLVTGAEPITEKLLTATNYSMINGSFADYDERWMLIGDAAYFVDPLFSSGVAFAMHHALSAALVLRVTADPAVSAEHKRDVWRDYDGEWHAIAQSFSLAIDQWYHAIGKDNPDSVYWRTRGGATDLDIRDKTFESLLSTTLEPDLLRVMTDVNGTQEDLDIDGPYMRAYAQADPGEPKPDDVLRTAPAVNVREGMALGIPGFKGFVPPWELPTEERAAIASYWRDPIENGDAIVSPLAEAIGCHRFTLGDIEIRSFADLDGGYALWELLAAGPVRYSDLREQIAEPQAQFLKLLLRARMVTFDDTSVGVE